MSLEPDLIPRLSVVMPCYNAERYVEAAVASILGQTFSDLELIAVDDGSSDSTLAILRRMAAADARMRVEAIEHRGIVGAPNHGFSLARGQFIARMDADDIALPERFTRQLAFLDEHREVDILGAQTITIDADGQRVGRGRRLPLAPEEIRAALRDGRCVLSHPCVVFRREAWLSSGGYHESDLPWEDLGLWRRLAEGHTMANLPEPLVLYRRHSQSLTWAAAVAAGRGADGRGGPEVRWALRAIRDRNWPVARKYALRAWRKQPSSPRRIHLLLAALRLAPRPRRALRRGRR